MYPGERTLGHDHCFWWDDDKRNSSNPAQFGTVSWRAPSAVPADRGSRYPARDRDEHWGGDQHRLAGPLLRVSIHAHDGTHCDARSALVVVACTERRFSHETGNYFQPAREREHHVEFATAGRHSQEQAGNCRSRKLPSTDDVFNSASNVRDASEFYDIERHRGDPGSRVGARDPRPPASRAGNGHCGTDTRMFRGYDWSAVIPFVDLEHEVVLVDDDDDEGNRLQRRLKVIDGLEVFEARAPEEGGPLNIKPKGPGGFLQRLLEVKGSAGRRFRSLPVATSHRSQIRHPRTRWHQRFRRRGDTNESV